jgi:hypothetical protein
MTQAGTSEAGRCAHEGLAASRTVRGIRRVVRNFMGKVSEGTATINLWWSCVGQSDFLLEGL